jgi:hypothetical protein
VEVMEHPSQVTTNDSNHGEPKSLRPWVVYALGTAFIVLLFVCYFQADLALAWMESVVRWLFMS